MAAEYTFGEAGSSYDNSNADTDDDKSELIASGTCGSKLTRAEI